MKQKKTTSWGWVIFWCILFWPIGLSLAIKKLSLKPKKTAITVLGWLFIAGAVCGLLTVFPESPEGVDKSANIMISFIFTIAGVVLLRKSSALKKTILRYDFHIGLISRGILDFNSLASANSISDDQAIKDLQQMIDIGYLESAYLDYANQKVAFIQQPGVPYVANNMPPVVQPQTETKSVRCPGCGANTVITVGRTSECEYCGTPIDMQASAAH